MNTVYINKGLVAKSLAEIYDFQIYDGYFSSPKENFIYDNNIWISIEQELIHGQGGELKSRNNGKIKFASIISSAALCVNNFTFFVNNLSSIKFKEYSKFVVHSFEMKLPTNISTPNIDFYLESNDTIIGFESKFTEYFTVKTPNKNLDKYLKLSYLPDSFIQLLNFYIDNNEKFHLDISQLIKHAIGLVNRKNKLQREKGKEYEPILVYIYWEPTNYSDFEILKKHRQEIIEFENKISPSIKFISLSYNEFWKLYEKNISFSSHIEKIKSKYQIKIKNYR